MLTSKVCRTTLVAVFFFCVVFGPTSTSLADDAKALSVQIRELRAEVERLSERISKLESSIGVAARPIDAPKPRVDRLAWHEASNWARVQGGMSRAQVEGILGKPTRVEKSIIDYVTLLYQGERVGSGQVSGNVQLNQNDRVIRVDKPVF